MSHAKKITILMPVYGSEVELVGEGGGPEIFHILAEFRIGDKDYAGLQSASMRKADEVAFFRIVTHQNSEPELESIEDEDEWEIAAEGYDDLIFEGEERP